MEISKENVEAPEPKGNVEDAEQKENVKTVEPTKREEGDAELKENVENIEPKQDIEAAEPAEKIEVVDDAKVADNDEKVEDDFVMIEHDPEYQYENNRVDFFTQVEFELMQQIEKCDYFKKVFEQQNNETLANMFGSYSVNTCRDLELLRNSWRNNEKLPCHKFEIISFNCLPTNVEVKDRELQLVVKTSGLPVDKKATTYVIGEFEFPFPKDESLASSFLRQMHHVRVEPRNILCCSSESPRQLDIVHSTFSKPFARPDSIFTEYTRPLSFFVEKGKSRTLKRKFKPIKLTFYEKRGPFRIDKRLGSVQIKIDSINDEISTMIRLPLVDGRKQTEAITEVKIKVREPLANKTIRNHEERLIMLS